MLKQSGGTLEILTQPGQRSVTRLLGPEASDAYTLAHSRWRGSLAVLVCMALLLTVVCAPAMVAKEHQRRAEFDRLESRGRERMAQTADQTIQLKVCGSVWW